MKHERENRKAQSGQAVLEYIILLSITLTGATLIARGILTSLDDAVLRFGGKLEKNLKTGRAPVGVWKN